MLLEISDESRKEKFNLKKEAILQLIKNFSSSGTMFIDGKRNKNRFKEIG